MNQEFENDRYVWSFGLFHQSPNLQETIMFLIMITDARIYYITDIETVVLKL